MHPDSRHPPRLCRRRARGGRLAPRPGPGRDPLPRRRTVSGPSRPPPFPLALLPPPAEPAATLAYGGAIPGPLLRLKKGEELKLRFSNKLAEPTTLCFAGLRTANAVAGYGGLTGPRLAPGASADIRFVPPDSGFNLYLPHAGATDAGQQGRGLFGPIVVDEAETFDVDEDVVVVLSDWSVDDKGGIKDDFADPALARRAGRRGGLVFANGAAAPLRLHGATRRAGAPETRQRRHRASDQCRDRRGEDASSWRSTASRASPLRRCATSSRWGPARASNSCSTCRARPRPR